MYEPRKDFQLYFTQYYVYNITLRYVTFLELSGQSFWNSLTRVHIRHEVRKVLILNSSSCKTDRVSSIGSIPALSVKQHKYISSKSFTTLELASNLGSFVAVFNKGCTCFSLDLLLTLHVLARCNYILPIRLVSFNILRLEALRRLFRKTVKLRYFRMLLELFALSLLKLI